MERPALTRLLEDITAGKVQIVVVYKVDRLTRSLADFAKIVDIFDVAHNASFVSVTQQFNTTTSMGRLTLNMLLSFAQFEREIAGERIRDKIAASRPLRQWFNAPRPRSFEASVPIVDILLHLVLGMTVALLDFAFKLLALVVYRGNGRCHIVERRTREFCVPNIFKRPRLPRATCS
jgi:DNA invertase Pin-like site-specific DNA recombinase